MDKGFKVSQPNDLKRILIAGGGSGGHLLAGISIADTAKEKWGQAHTSILFVGTQGRLDEKLIPKAGYPLETLKIGLLKRVSLKTKFTTLMQLPLTFLRSFQILYRFRPEFVIGVGGYSSGPLVLMARILSFFPSFNIFTAILEQNSIPGFTNRILGKFVHCIFTAFPGSEVYFPGKKIYVTGNPIRLNFKKLPPAHFEPFTIFTFGGSQGAIGLNTLVLATLNELQDLKKEIHWIHQTGEKDYERVLQGYLSLGYPVSNIRVEKYIDKMEEAYQKSSLLICRSGSSTLSEIAAVGRASLLVPLPTAADNHQEKNALIFSQASAAILVNQEKTSAKELAQQIRELYKNPIQIAKMEETVTQFYRPQAANEILRMWENQK